MMDDPAEVRISGHLAVNYEDEAQAALQPEDRATIFKAEMLTGVEPLLWDGALPDAPDVRAQFFPKQYHVPEIRMDRWRDVRVAGAGIMFTPRRTVLHGLVPVGGEAEQLLKPFVDLDVSVDPGTGAVQTPLLEAEETVEAAVLISRGAPGNYHHVLMDIVPRIHVLAEAVARPDLAGRWEDLRNAPILINAEMPEWALFMLETVGVPRERLRPLPSHGCLRADRLYVPGVLNNFAVWVSPETRRFYEPLYSWAKATAPNVRFGPKIYALRREMQVDRRRFHHVDALAQQLEARGYVEVRTGAMSWAEQIIAFAEAETIVSAMGSNISNMIFSRPGSRILILHPEDSVYSLNVAMAAAGGQDIGYLWADCFSNALRGEHVELYVNPDYLDRALDRLQE